MPIEEKNTRKDRYTSCKQSRVKFRGYCSCALTVPVPIVALIVPATIAGLSVNDGGIHKTERECSRQ
jgi:hypothetical protein